MAGTCLTDTKSIDVDARKRNRKILVTTILPKGMSREHIESQVGKKVFGNCLADVVGINQLALAAKPRLVLLGVGLRPAGVSRAGEEGVTTRRT